MEIESVAVAGSGIVGAGIAQVLAVAGYGVRLFDVREEAISATLDRIENGRYGLHRSVERGRGRTHPLPRAGRGLELGLPCSDHAAGTDYRAPRTSEETTRAVVDAATRCGKNPRVIRDQPLEVGVRLVGCSWPSCVRRTR